MNIALEGVIRRARLNSRGTIFTKSGQFVCFADDMDIIARIFGTAAELYTRLKREAAKVGLVVNASKTKYKQYFYLVSLLTADNNVSREFRRRIISGSRAYYGLQKKAAI